MSAFQTAISIYLSIYLLKEVGSLGSSPRTQRALDVATAHSAAWRRHRCCLLDRRSLMVILTAALAPLLGAAIVVNPSAVPALARPHVSRTTVIRCPLPTDLGRATATAPSWQLASTLSTIDALEQTGGARPHSLLTGLFDEASGLCSEGVWHNSWLGVGRLLAARELRRAGDDELAYKQLRAAHTLGESLYRLSYDRARGGFRRRSASGFWQSATERF